MVIVSRVDHRCFVCTSKTRSSENNGSSINSGSSMGKWTIAASSSPFKTRGMRLDVPPSWMIARTRGWVFLRDGSSRGISHLPVVPMQPRRVSPSTSVSLECTSASMSCNSWIMRRARSTTTVPSSVSDPPLRSTRTTPRSFSSLEIWADTLLCTVPRARAAPENEPWSAIAIRLARWRISIAIRLAIIIDQPISKIDRRYRAVRLARLPMGTP